MIAALLVDDDPRFARSAARVLRLQRGIRVDDCRTARAALRRLSDRHYDAVLVDWILGGEDGLTLGARIRALPRGSELAIIMLTGSRIADEDEMTAFSAGFDDFVRKPFNPAVLSVRIAAAVTRANNRRNVARRRASSSGVTATWDAQADDHFRLLADEPVAFVGLERITLSELEWKLAKVLYVRRGQVVHRDMLVKEIWGAAPPANVHDSLAHLLSSLRHKLDPHELAPRRRLLETIRGIGARLLFGSQLLASPAAS
jgi:DNA-binding response OmpR family regulator